MSAAGVYGSQSLVVGTRLGGRSRTVTETDVVTFGAMTGDRHPVHMDAEYAARSRFGQRIAHGCLILSYALGLLGIPPNVVALRRINEATFKAPVFLGDTIRADAEVTALTPVDKQHGLVELDVRIVNQEDRLIVRAQLTVLWMQSEHARPVEDAEHDRLWHVGEIEFMSPPL